ncbi:MAG TPA: response regulator [Acidimicrobiales bacterium]
MASNAPQPRVLVADDDPDIRRILAVNLEAMGYQVTEVSDGEEALRLARQMVPAFVVLDVMMPELDGYGVLHSLRGHPVTARIPVVMLSALTTDRDIWDGWQAGADYYLTKPFMLDELLHFVELLELGRPPEGAVLAP